MIGNIESIMANALTQPLSSPIHLEKRGGMGRSLYQSRFSLLSAYLSIFLFILLVFEGVNLNAKNSDLRTVHIKLAISFDSTTIETCQVRLLKVMRNCSFIFKKRFGIRLKIKEIEYWKFDRRQEHIEDWLNDLRRKVSPGRCDMVLGVISPRNSRNAPFGIAKYFGGYVLIRYLRSDTAMKALLLHELCHMFGAVDLNEPNSLMDTSNAGMTFDEFTSNIILLNKQRSFLPESFPLSENLIDEAIALYKQRADLYSDKPEVDICLFLSFLYLQKRKYSLATEQCNKVLELNPTAHQIHSYLGKIYLKQGAYDQAIKEYSLRLKFSPNSFQTHFNLALAYAKKGMAEKAEAGYRKAINLNPLCAKAFVYLGHLFYKTGRIEASIDMCQRALEISPSYPEALCISAAAQIRKANAIAEKTADLKENERYGLVLKAIKGCEKALAIKSNMPEAHNIMGIGHALLQKFEGAEKEFLAALELNSCFMPAHYNLGILYYQNHQITNGAFHLKKILELNPDSRVRSKILALIFKSQRGYESSLASPENPQFSTETEQFED